MNTELLQFAMHLTGDGEEDIEQMYNDWINSPSTPSFAPEQQAEVSQTDEEAAHNYAFNLSLPIFYEPKKEAFLAGCQYVRQQLSQHQPEAESEEEGLTAREFLIKYTFRDKEEAANEQNDKIARMMESYYKYKAQQFQPAQPAPFTESWKQHIQQQIDELRKWKAEAIQERKGREWISVEKQLPEIGQDVAFVVTNIRESLNNRVLGGRYLGQEFDYNDFSIPGHSYDAKYWMPLPPPPTNHQ